MDTLEARRRAPQTDHRRRLAPLAAAIAAVVAIAGGTRAHAAECADLARLRLDHAHVETAELVRDGRFEVELLGRRVLQALADFPVFCRVRGVSSPVAGSHIGFEVWLPQPDRWTRRLHMVGNGGYSSDLYYAQMNARIRAGDVAVGTDTGHHGAELTFAIGHPEAIKDFAFRAVHESVVAAQAVTAAFYGQHPAYSYFSGCSTGGYQALMEAQRFPDDFDGIIAGDPGNNRSNLNLAFLWQFTSNHPQGDNEHQIVPASKLLVLNQAIVRQCDSLDGVVDGVINDPRACRFDVGSLRCRSGDADNCLTPVQVATIRRMYAGPQAPGADHALYPGYSLGSEGVRTSPSDLPGWSAYWSNPARPNEPQRADFFRYWAFDDANWDWWKFDWATGVRSISQGVGKVINATDPDLGRFSAHHGKLIIFMGWQDPVGAPQEAINYYEAVAARAPGRSRAARLQATQAFARLYMVPGMAHCAGGPGATHFSTATRDSVPPVSDAQHDMAVALQDWVEKGVAPQALIATKFEGAAGPGEPIAFQRPLCVYPNVARYRSGATTSASSFVCAAPRAGLVSAPH